MHLGKPILALAWSLAWPAGAAIIGTNPPARPLTAGRISELPPNQRSEWKAYLERSARQERSDQAFLGNEMRKLGLSAPIVPPAGRSVRSLPLDRPSAWYGETEARRLADNVVSFQTPAGGWSKNLDFSQHPRAPGEGFAPDNGTRYPTTNDFDGAPLLNWSYVGTFDNGATTTQLRLLARVVVAAGTKESAKYREAFLRGVDYILAAQYPNGGWPQVWPLEGGYHDAITYNDNAMVNVLEILRDTSEGGVDFKFVPTRVRKRARQSVERGIGCILATQGRVDGRLTAWGQQHDPLTLLPTSARNYEMPALAASESAGILAFLMTLPNPPAEIVAAVHGAAEWLKRVAIRDVAFRRVGDDGRHLVPAPGAGPIWSRYYQIGDNHPIFGDRDKTIHDTVEEISKERRIGYAWYSESPAGAFERYSEWSKTHP